MGIVVRGDLIGGIGGYSVLRDGPDYALGATVGAFQLLPGIRGYWPMSSVDSGGEVHDLSGQLRTLTQAGTPTLGQSGTLSLGPCLSLNGTTQRLYRVSEVGLSITGAMTCGLWFKLDTFASGVAPFDIHLLSKWNTTGNQRSWSLYVDAANGYIEADVSTDGTAVTSVLGDQEMNQETWYFAAMRFTPSTELAVFTYDTKWTNTTSIPASIYSSTAQLEIGSVGNGGTIDLDGKVGMAFVAAYALSDAQLRYLYYLSRPLFGLTNYT